MPIEDTSKKQAPNAQQFSNNANVGGAPKNNAFAYNSPAINNFAEQSNVLFQRYSVLDESLEKLSETVREIIPIISTGSAVKLDVVSLSRKSQRNILYNTLLITANLKDTNIKAVYALILARQDDVINKTSVKVKNIEGYNDQLDLYPTQLVNDTEAIDNILARVKEEDASYNVIYAGGSVVFIDRNTINDRDSITASVINAAQACINNIYRVSVQNGNQPTEINLAKLDNAYTIYVEKMPTFNVLKDVHDNVVRADFTFKITSRNAEQKRVSSLINGAEITDVAQTTGYLDFRRTQPDSSPQINGWGGYNSSTTKVRYLPAIVFTSLTPIQNQSIGNLLFTLATSVNATKDNGCWIIKNMLNPSRQPAKWLNNINGLGLEISATDGLKDIIPLDINDSAKLEEFIYKYVAPDTLYQLEIREGSPDEWIYRIFLQAATERDVNNPNSVNSEIIRYADYITNGLFGNIYRQKGGSGRVVYPLNNQMRPQGVYQNKELGLRPLTDIDRFRILNILVNSGTKDREAISRAINEYSSAIGINNNLSADYRLSILKNIYQTFNSGSLIYGYSRFITFESVFLNALIDAIIQCGLRVNTNTQFSFNDTTVYDPIDMAISNGGGSFFSSTAQNSWSGGDNYNSPFFNFHG